MVAACTSPAPVPSSQADGSQRITSSQSVGAPAPVSPPPVLTLVAPARGSTEGGMILQVDGTGFGPTITLRIGGGVAYSGNVGNAFFIAQAPPGIAGTADIVLTNADGQTSTLKNAFTFVPPASLEA